MRELERRLERLEQWRQASDEMPTVFIHFVGHPRDDPDAAVISPQGNFAGDTLTQAPGESIAAFKHRAAAHFEGRRRPGCGLTLFLNGASECAS